MYYKIVEFKILKIFLGPPGSGKTTSAQMLGRNHDYNVYEADCYVAFKNPLVDPNDEHPFFSMAKKKPMKVLYLVPKQLLNK